jgi:hypothetical protein
MMGMAAVSHAMVTPVDPKYYEPLDVDAVASSTSKQQ